MGNGCSMSADCSCSTTSDSTGVLLPRALGQLAKWHKVPPQRAWAVPIIRGHKTRDHMETLDLATLALLDALEADLEVPDFDADEMLDGEA